LDDLASEIDDIVSTTSWSGQTLLDGTFTGKQFQVGEESSHTMSFGISQDHRAAGLTVADGDLDVSTASAASTSLANVNAAIGTLNTSLQTLGSTQLRVGIKEANISVSINNQLASHNRIFNADMAEEQVNLIKFSMLQQTSIAMLAQANNAPQSMLQLIFG
jgi:flagellin